jgi:GNAT superfamily N-acetyltransferase
MEFETVHSWLTTSYWSPGVSLEDVKRAAQNSSLVIGAFVDGKQVGYLRVVSDKTTFGWICDVYVEEAHRGHGIAKQMVKRAVEDPEHPNLRRWVLATRDAHAIYMQCGFHPLRAHKRWLIMGSNPSV